MRIGYDLSERVVAGRGDSRDVRRILGAIGDCEKIDGVVVVSAFRTSEADEAEGRDAWRRVTAHPLLALLPRVWRNLRMPAHLNRNGIDVYHALTGEIPWRMAYSPLRMVVSVDDVSFLLHPDAFGAWDRFARRCRCYFSCRVAHRVIAPDDRSRRALVAFGVEDGKIAVMMPYSFRDAEGASDKPEAERVRERYELPERFFLMSGAVVASGSYGEAVEALATMVREGRCGSDVGLVICGRRTEYSDRLLEYADKSAAAGRVNIIYECGGRDMAALRSMAAGELFLPQAERSARTVADAVRAGIPMIVSDRENFREAAGDAALYVDPFSPDEIAAAMTMLLDDGACAARLGEAMRRRAAEWSPESAARRLVEIYEAL